MTPATLDEARAAKERIQAAFGRMPEIVGIGIARVDGGYGVKVNLSHDPGAAESLPDHWDGVPVRVEVVGTIRRSTPGG